MGPKQLAGVLSIVRRNAAEAAGRPFDDAADEELRAGHRGADRGGVDGAVRHGPAVGRRHHRPARHAHRARHRPRPRCTRPRCGAPRSSAWCGTDGRRSAPIRVLVANRGEIARRAHPGRPRRRARGGRRLRGRRRRWPHVGEADAAVLLPGATLAETYLNPAALRRRRRGGGGRRPAPRLRVPLREPAPCPRPASAAGIIWVGPPPDAMRVMGHKARAKEVGGGGRASPCCRAPWSPTARAGRARGRRGGVGYPLLVKARPAEAGAACGSCRIRASLADAVASAQREAAAAFGSDEVFLERYLRLAPPRRGPGGRRHPRDACCTSSTASARSSAATRRWWRRRRPSCVPEATAAPHVGRRRCRGARRRLRGGGHRRVPRRRRATSTSWR